MHVNWAYGVVVSHPLRMRKALGSNPSGSTFSTKLCHGIWYGLLERSLRANDMKYPCVCVFLLMVSMNKYCY